MKSALLFLAVPLFAAQNGGVVEGTAFNRMTRAAVAGATVKLAVASMPGHPLHEAKSDATGAFRITDLPDGDYVPSFDAPDGFMAPASGDPCRRVLHVSVAAGPAKLEAPLRPQGNLRGRVLDPQGHPAPRVRVEFFTVHDWSGHILTTDGEGRFFAKGIMPGAYRLRARPVLAGTPLGTKSDALTPLPAKPSEGDRWIWAPTYYPNSIEMSGAETIVVHEGAELDGYQIWLRAAPVYRLRGVVRDDEGKPAAAVTLWLLSELRWGPAEAQVTSGNDGRFEFPSVRAGEWQIEAEIKRDGIRWMGFVQMAMAQHDVDNTVVHLAPPFTMDSRVEWIPPGETGKNRLTVRLNRAGGSYGQESTSTTQPDGTAQFQDLYPGRYRVDVFRQAPGYYLKSILLGSQDVTGQDIDLAPNSPPLKVIYKSNDARVRGQVENGAGAVVIVIAPDEAHSVDGDSPRVGACDIEGRFSVEGLRPGSYLVLATYISGNVNTGAIAEMVYVRGLNRQAKTIQLEEGETAAVNMKITPWPE